MKGYLVLISFLDADLMEALPQINLSENLSALEFIKQVIYLGNWKPALDSGPIQFPVVNAHTV